MASASLETWDVSYLDSGQMVESLFFRLFTAIATRKDFHFCCESLKMKMMTKAQVLIPNPRWTFNVETHYV